MKRSTGEYIDDKAVTAKVKAALLKDPEIKALQVKVETYNGVVQLSGFVDKPEQISRAGEVAKGVEGVKSVKNDLNLRSKPGKY
jgi:osmotically-inducible protein OsmY